MRSFKYSTLAALAIFALAACSTLGVPTPKTFEERTAAAYASVAAVRDSAATLLVAGKITVEDAENVQAQADTTRAGIDIARQIHAADPAKAEDRLGAVIVGLQALEAYLRSRQ